jgi:HSF-type DNA-binding
MHRDTEVTWNCYCGRSLTLFHCSVGTSRLLSWFRMSKMASFQRQLNLYGFQRLTSGKNDFVDISLVDRVSSNNATCLTASSNPTVPAGRDRNGYYHELFLRQRQHLATRIRRFKVKGHGMRKAASPETEPNLYALPFLPSNSDSASSEKGAGQSPVGGSGSIPRKPEVSLRGLLPRALSLAPVQSVLSATSQLSTGRGDDRFANLMGFHSYQTLRGSIMLPPTPRMAASSRNAALVTALAAGDYGDPLTLALFHNASDSPRFFAPLAAAASALQTRGSSNLRWFHR